MHIKLLSEIHSHRGAPCMIVFTYSLLFEMRYNLYESYENGIYNFVPKQSEQRLDQAICLVQK